MDSLNVLVTGAGAPGIKGTLYSLKNNFDARRIKTLGTDADAGAVGRYFCDAFEVIPPAIDEERYLESMERVCRDGKIDVVVPQNTSELSLLSKKIEYFKRMGVSIVVSNPTSIQTANDKYRLLKLCEELDIPTPMSFLAENVDSLKDRASRLGWPQARVVVKPPLSNGMRGLRIIDETRDQKKAFYGEKPDSVFLGMEQLVAVLGSTFPTLMVCEYLPGDEFTVDVLRTRRGSCVVPRRRDVTKAGITFVGTVVNEQRISEYSKRLSDALDMENCFGFQFKLNRQGEPSILECNPRVQGTMVLSTLAGANIIYGGVKNALGEEVPQFEIKWGTEIRRFWGGLGIGGDGIHEI